PTFRARPKPSSARWTRWATTRSAPAPSIRAPAASPRATSTWPSRPGRRSWASTSAPRNRRATWPSVKASRSATTRSSTTCWTTLRACSRACWRRSSAKPSWATP
ncbi:hypothetical protein LTR94_036041, partial [Friedmanniomyces endolithicus]